MNTYIYKIHIHILKCTNEKHTYKYTYINIYIYTYINIYIHKHTYTYIYINTYIYIYICVCIYIYIRGCEAFECCYLHIPLPLHAPFFLITCTYSQLYTYVCM